MKPLITGELAKRAGVNVETLRFFERKGLLPAPPRRSSGYRQLPPESLRLVQFIKRAQGWGFALGEILELLSLRVQPGATPAEVRERAERKLADIRLKLADLKVIEKAPGKITAACSGSGPLTDCPILHHLDGEV